MRASHDLRADLTLLTANKMSGSQQLFGSNNLVVAGSEQENWAAYYREINRASERCETASLPTPFRWRETMPRDGRLSKLGGRVAQPCNVVRTRD